MTSSYAYLYAAALELPGVGPAKVKKMADKCPQPESWHDLMCALALVCPKLANDADLERSVKLARAAASAKIEKAKADGQVVLSLADEGYPSQLKDLTNPPAVLYCKGALSALASIDEMVAVVGSRNASEYGLSVAKRFGGYLSEKGLNVVSGLAIGVDAYAHESCVDSEGRAVAVLPAGLDNITPKQNKELAERILGSGGVLVSEQSPDTIVTKNLFVERDRIVAALSKKIIVVETTETGGTMKTVGFAEKLKRGIGAWDFPQDHQYASSLGNTLLIRSGRATALRNGASIDEFLQDDVPATLF